MTLTRRSFISAAGTTVVAGALAGAALADEAPGFDEQYDVVVVGFGFAGASAAIAAVDAGAQSVLVVDAAPEGQEGGNSRYCAQIAVYGPDKDGLMAYYRALGQHMDQDEEVLDAYTDGIMGIPDIMRRMGVEEPCIWKEFTATVDKPGDGGPDETPEEKLKRMLSLLCPEYPELEGSDTLDVCTIHPACFDGAFYPVAQDAVKAEEAVTIWLESPATSLVQDPETKRVIGVVVEHEGKTVRVSAKGVVLACGGFECNRQMKQDYLGVPRLAPLGGMYNNGDGIRMAQELGADLWHMHNYEALGMMGGHAYEVPDGERAILLMTSRFAASTKGALICVADDGSRFLPEGQADRHGHVYSHGVWKIPNQAYRPHIVFDEQQKELIKANDQLPDEASGILVSADSARELAALIDADPDVLEKTIAKFNRFCEIGEDEEFGRDPETMRAFEGDKLYAIALQPTVLNTQGGPRRNAHAQVMHVSGEPIEGLYSAGELGGVNAFYYQGGGNVAECLVFGKIAGTNAVMDAR